MGQKLEGKLGIVLPNIIPKGRQANRKEYRQARQADTCTHTHTRLDIREMTLHV